ncbi:hypothetical protein [Klebsiella pneumoniae]|uniref:hypothetical protein n=1 Tax=Klebsiella pneumoniae TaxID=573 RepID=UPI001E5EA206|nr:hypothetical protein [Klebsiella pneumoniae]
MRDLLKVVLSLVLAMASGQALADLPIVLVDEARLPYDYSPSNYDISPSNYDNSISNYDNSPSNYDNSESNYDNSSTRWPTYQAPAAAQPGDRLDAVRQVPPLLQAAARPGGQRTRHRQQLNQVIASML